MATDGFYLRGLLALWDKDKNPLWIWCVIKTCIKNGDPFPPEATKYLSGVADTLLSKNAAHGDFGRTLPKALGFRPTGKHHPLRAGQRMVSDEKFAVAFMVGILNNQSPAEARACAGNTEADDRTLQRKLKAFFGLRRRLPNDNAAWRKITIRWMVENWDYRTQYPQLPPLTNDLVNEIGPR